MKKLLLASMTLAMVAGTASATAIFKTSKLTQEQRSELRQKAKKSGESIFMPYHEEEYAYENNEYVKKSEAQYTYDTNGKELTFLTTSSTSTNYTTYVYDAEGRLVSSINQYADAGQPLVNQTKREFTYDPIIKDYKTASTQYEWNGSDWQLVGNGYTWKRHITRDANGNITQILTTTYFNGEYKDHHRTTLTYNEAGKADSWKYEEIAYVGGVLAWDLFYTMTDMEWHKTDGQITATEPDDFFEGTNLLSKGTYTQGSDINTLSAEYGDNGYNSIVLGSDGIGQTREYTNTDDNGSYVVINTNCTDANGDGKITTEELGDRFKSVITYNTYGKCESELYYYNDELDGGIEYTMTYGDYTTVPEVWIASEYNPDTNAFEPFIKLVRSDYRDVTVNGAVDTIVANNANAPIEIYTIQGVRVNSDINKLDAGIYIKKQGNKVTKFIK